MRFSSREIKEIAISTVVLAFAFGGVDGFISALFAVGIAFMAHEILGHKMTAQRYGHFAEYRMWPQGLLLAIVFSFFGFVFAAPGAVYIAPYKGDFAFRVTQITKKEYGIISLAGPVVNIALGIVFVVTSLWTGIPLFALAARISFFLAMFNMIPFAPLDGQKVLSWNKGAWAGVMAASVMGYIFVL